MKYLILYLFIVPLLAFSFLHKYYVSVTQIEYASDKKAVQIVSRIFIDDLEQAVRNTYDNSITFAFKDESEMVNKFIEKYLEDHLIVKINDKKVKLNFIGKEYDTDLVKCYLEVENIKKIESLEITNSLLFDIFSEQQNITKTKINGKQQSFILINNDETVLLKFN